MVDQQRGVDVVLALGERHAADRGMGALAGKAHEHLVAHKPRIGIEGKTVE